MNTKIEWFDASLVWPSSGCLSLDVIVQGGAHVSFKQEYQLKGHGDFGVFIKYFSLIEEVQTEKEIDLSSAFIYKIDGFCCNDTESQNKHANHMKKIAASIGKLRDFIDKEELYASWDLVERWQFLDSSNDTSSILWKKQHE